MSTLNQERQQSATCHPDAEHVANGLCAACYSERYYLKAKGWDSIYDEMFAAQGGLCAICTQTCRTGKRLSVDHDHVTGAVRGLLCRTCNAGLGSFNDDPKMLLRAADYLERFR